MGKKETNLNWMTGQEINSSHVGFPNGSADGSFRYDAQHRYVEEHIDLVVGKPSSYNALDLLRSFDLTICKCSFDGQRVRIPDPYNSLCAQTTMDPARSNLLGTFFLAEGSSCREQVIAIPPSVWAEVGLENGHRAVVESHGDVSRHRTKPCPWYTLVEFLMKLISRMQKYTVREILILDAHGTISSLAFDWNRFLNFALQYEVGTWDLCYGWSYDKSACDEALLIRLGIHQRV